MEAVTQLQEASHQDTDFPFQVVGRLFFFSFFHIYFFFFFNFSC